MTDESKGGWCAKDSMAPNCCSVWQILVDMYGTSPEALHGMVTVYLKLLRLLLEASWLGQVPVWLLIVPMLVVRNVSRACWNVT